MKIEKIAEKAKLYGIPIVRSQTHILLEEMVKKYQPINILEIGTAVGYSGTVMLKAAPKAKLTTIEHNKKFAMLARHNFRANNVHNRVKLIEGDCLVELARLVSSGYFDESFDFIFLDGPKAQYNNMLELLMSLLSNNGILLVDNVLFRGYTSGETTPPTKRFRTIIKRLNEFIENCKKHQNLTEFKLLDIEDGVIFAKKVRDER